MSYAEYRRQSIDLQESVVDQINAELRDAGVGTISHQHLKSKSLAALSAVSVTQ
jgi:hypothetical protein